MAVLDVDRQIGPLPPCNVVVRTAGVERTSVSVQDSQVMVSVPGDEGLRQIADDAGRRIRSAPDALTGG